MLLMITKIYNTALDTNKTYSIFRMKLAQKLKKDFAIGLFTTSNFVCNIYLYGLLSGEEPAYILF